MNSLKNSIYKKKNYDSQQNEFQSKFQDLKSSKEIIEINSLNQNDNENSKQIKAKIEQSEFNKSMSKL